MKPRCYNRPDYYNTIEVPDGWQFEGMLVGVDFDRPMYKRRTKVIDNRMSKECQQWGEFGEARRMNWDCDGCRHDPRRNG